MRKLSSLIFLTSLLNAQIAPLDQGRILGVEHFGQTQTYKLGMLWMQLQGKYFHEWYFWLLVGVFAVFSLHYLIIGPKKFSHEGKKILAFNLFSRFIHALAAIGFTLLVPTGLIMIFGTHFGGGAFVRSCRYLHDIGTLFFLVAVFPMFFMWLKDMLPRLADIKWLMIAGGYLSKEIRPVPAYKYNAGQKMWFWTATAGGFLMISTGILLFFNNTNMQFLVDISGLHQISILRISAILHNIFGLAIVAFFITHIYMAVFAIKGAIWSMINGYKEESEVKNLHSLWYEKLKKEKKI